MAEDIEHVVTIVKDNTVPRSRLTTIHWSTIPLWLASSQPRDSILKPSPVTFTH
jgi:hypothetical protein